MGLMLSRAARLAVAGLAVGLAGAMATARTLGGMLFGLKALDGPTYLGGRSRSRGGNRARAAVGPEWRGTRVDPLVSLRRE